MYVFTNTKKDDNISTQKYLWNLLKEQTDGENDESGLAIGLAIQQMKWFSSDLPGNKGGNK